MHVTRIHSLADLASEAPRWNTLARNVPLRSWPWLESWWRHYGDADPAGGNRELYTLTIREAGGRLIGIAPWYMERTATQGRVLRFLGDGEVCTDYLSLLCAEEDESEVAHAVASWLTDRAIDDGVDEADRWDLLEIAGVDADDRVIQRLLDELVLRNNLVHKREAPRCWRAALPGTWDDYMAGLSKGHRKQIRRLERGSLDNGRVRLHWATDAASLARAMEVLVDLHQRRRHSLGEAGCFSSSRFSAFHHEVTARLLQQGWLRLAWLELDGRPLAAEYHMAAGGVVYAYQSGLDPDLLEEEPGRIAAIATIKQAISDGQQAIDFLRGDEVYKAHWRAEPRPQMDIQVVPSRKSARLRHSVRTAGSSVKNLLKTGLEWTGSWTPAAPTKG